jgi:hypothetical protein
MKRKKSAYRRAEEVCIPHQTLLWKINPGGLDIWDM